MIQHSQSRPTTPRGAFHRHDRTRRKSVRDGVDTNRETGVSVFEEALASIDCSIQSDYAEGDHTIYVGAVEAADVQRTDAAPLTFYQGN
ncbi:flavin reductase family protein [Halocatena marina]|uniref:flavin reductase family protein n=1 Tax=Halocatena marina TaxID=2934937 RepID=UPI002413FB30|nr:flavin reductase family protein [Halocatena marina]